MSIGGTLVILGLIGFLTLMYLLRFYPYTILGGKTQGTIIEVKSPINNRAMQIGDAIIRFQTEDGKERKLCHPIGGVMIPRAEVGQEITIYYAKRFPFIVSFLPPNAAPNEKPVALILALFLAVAMFLISF